MGNIEREIKLLDIDVSNSLDVLQKIGAKLEGKYIQNVYTFDLPTVDTLYDTYLKEALSAGDNRGLIKLVKEIRPCISKADAELIKDKIGSDDLLSYIQSGSNLEKLQDQELVNLMKQIEERFFKWIRLRQTGDEVTITIKKVLDGAGEYELDAVEEIEFNIPSKEEGLHFLEDLGYFVDRHQEKMRIAFAYKNCEIVIDKWPMIKPYIEVEGPTEKEIKEVVEILGYSEEQMVVINTDDVYAAQGINLYDIKELKFSEKEQEEVHAYINLI